MFKYKKTFIIFPVLLIALLFWYIFNSQVQNISWVDLSHKSNDKHRLAVFAAYSRDGTIPNSTIYYLKELQKTVDGIVFISDNPIKKSEAKKIKPYVMMADFKKHGEYDFGSYKRGLQFLRNQKLLTETDSLILANDSCYGPVYPLNPILNQMDETNADFYGMASSDEYHYHIQSYFLVFRPSVLKTDALDHFLAQVQHQKNGWDVVMAYETNLTHYLQKLGYRAASYTLDEIMLLGKYSISSDKTFMPVTLMKTYHFPFIKKKVFIKEGDFYKRLLERPDDVLTFLKGMNSPLYNLISAEVQ